MYQEAEACQILKFAITKDVKYSTKTLISIEILSF